MPTKKQKENRAKLVAALRSGKYQQGRGYLNHVGFCCQGVACDIFKKEVKGKWVTPEFGDDTDAKEFAIGERDDYDFSDSGEWPNQVEHDLLGFDHFDSNQFVLMNDGRTNFIYTWPENIHSSYTLLEDCTFDEIADCMELLTLAGL